MSRRLHASLLLITAVAIAAALVEGCSREAPAQGPYFGLSPVGSSPEVFAPGLISLPDRFEYSIVFSPDLKECVFGVTDATWSSFTLLYTTMAEDGTWSDPVIAPFLGDGDGLSPAYSNDGNSLLFASFRPHYPPSNLWQVRREGRRGWSAPVMIPAPVSTAADEFAPSLTRTGVLYFVSGRPGGAGDADIYRSVPVGDRYDTVKPVGAPINSAYLDSTPFIAPDESYIIFESNRPGGYGQQDLYISFREGDLWSAPRNLGPEVNTEQIEDEAYVSPDGKYLFFNRRAAYETSEQTELYWMELRSILDSTAPR